MKSTDNLLEQQQQQQQKKNNDQDEMVKDSTSSVPPSRRNGRLNTRSTPSSSATRPELGATTKPNDNTDIASSEEWTEVEDPDTGETFYWNEESDAIRWEI
jgi:hypothetical protein